MSKRSEAVFSLSGTPEQISEYVSIIERLSGISGDEIFEELFSDKSEYAVVNEEIQTEWRYRWHCGSVKWDYEAQDSLNKLAEIAKTLGLSGVFSCSAEGEVSTVFSLEFGDAAPGDDIDFHDRNDGEEPDECLDDEVEVRPDWDLSNIDLLKKERASFPETLLTAVLKKGEKPAVTDDETLRASKVILTCMSMFGDDVCADFVKDGAISAVLKTAGPSVITGIKASPKMKSLLEAVVLSGKATGVPHKAISGI